MWSLFKKWLEISRITSAIESFFQDPTSTRLKNIKNPTYTTLRRGLEKSDSLSSYRTKKKYQKIWMSKISNEKKCIKSKYFENSGKKNSLYTVNDFRIRLPPNWAFYFQKWIVRAYNTFRCKNLRVKGAG